MFDFQWFKEKYLPIFQTELSHLDTLQDSAHKDGSIVGINSNTIKEIITICDKVISLANTLPDTRWWIGTIREIKWQLDVFKDKYWNWNLSSQEGKDAYWEFTEIRFNIFTICNYMEAMCED